MKKWYNFETMFKSLRDCSCRYLKEHHIRYELSGCYEGYHFEIFASEAEAGAIDDFLDSICIYEER